MGLKLFKKKEPTEDEIREELMDSGITTKQGNKRREKFGAFKHYAEEKRSTSTAFTPMNPYANHPVVSAENPYANQHPQSMQLNQHKQNPYLSNPYESGVSNQYGQPTANRQPPPKNNNDDTQSLSFNDIPTDYQPPNRQHAYNRAQLNSDNGKDLDDLNELPDDDIQTFAEPTSEDEENEEIEGIKGEIRFVKQESLASTRNTIRLAQEAEASGHNTLGMLGSQSERLYNTENNLNLADTQTKIADQKVGELKSLNRSIFLPRASNPFNRKARLQKKEAAIKSERMQEKVIREHNRQGMYDSETRIKAGLKAKPTELQQKYQDTKNLSLAARYQFENDSEDDDMEKELANNLNEIDSYATRLKKLAITTGDEVDKQNLRLRQIEEDADRIDLSVHLNTSRLNNIR